MWLANVTSCDHTSYCHFCRPITPQRTFPVCTPTRMLISTPVASRSLLQGHKRQGNGVIVSSAQRQQWKESKWKLCAPFIPIIIKQKYKWHGPDCSAHVQPHLNTVPGVVGDGVWKSRHTVVTVAQDLNAKTSVFLQTPEAKHSRAGHKQHGRKMFPFGLCRFLYLGDVVKPAEELVEHSDQLLGRAGARQFGEAHDICVQDAAQTPTTVSHTGLTQKYTLNLLLCLVLRLIWT